MPKRTRRDRDHPERAPEEVVIESWVENLGVYLTIPVDDALRHNTDIGRKPSRRRSVVNDSFRH